jgi:hypothetical protein
MVDITAQAHQIARQDMIRLSDENPQDPVALGRCAALAGLSPEAFRSRFQPAVSNMMGTGSQSRRPNENSPAGREDRTT